MYVQFMMCKYITIVSLANLFTAVVFTDFNFYKQQQHDFID